MTDVGRPAFPQSICPCPADGFGYGRIVQLQHANQPDIGGCSGGKWGGCSGRKVKLLVTPLLNER